MYKTVIYNEKETNYLIYDNGECYNIKTKKFLQGSIKSNGYKMVTLTINKEKKTLLVHRLVAEHFLPNPDNKDYVNHIDGNKLNNNVSNLEWVTPQENRIHALKTGLCNNKKKKNNININNEYEKWKRYQDTDYIISDLGRIKNQKTGKILQGTITSQGYIRLTIKINDKRKNKLLHQLVYETFCENFIEKENFVINHIDGNKLNNSYNNLEYVSQSQNVLHSVYVLSSKQAKQCFQYTLNGQLVKKYDSLTQAAKEIDGNVGGLSLACNGKIKTYKGYIWKNF